MSYAREQWDTVTVQQILVTIVQHLSHVWWFTNLSYAQVKQVLLYNGTKRKTPQLLCSSNIWHRMGTFRPCRVVHRHSATPIICSYIGHFDFHYHACVACTSQPWHGGDYTQRCLNPIQITCSGQSISMTSFLLVSCILSLTQPNYSSLPMYNMTTYHEKDRTVCLLMSLGLPSSAIVGLLSLWVSV